MKQGEVTLQHLFAILLADEPYLLAGHVDGIVLGYPGDDFFLLGLVVDDGDFYFFFVHELFPESAISGGDGDGLSVDFGHHARDNFPYIHHGPVTNPGISFYL